MSVAYCLLDGESEGVGVGGDDASRCSAEPIIDGPPDPRCATELDHDEFWGTRIEPAQIVVEIVGNRLQRIPASEWFGDPAGGKPHVSVVPGVDDRSVRTVAWDDRGCDRR